MSFADAEVRTRSVPAAGDLICMGFEVLGTIVRPDGVKLIRFAPAAREELEKFFAAKQVIDQIFDDAGGARVTSHGTRFPA